MHINPSRALAGFGVFLAVFVPAACSSSNTEDRQGPEFAGSSGSAGRGGSAGMLVGGSAGSAGAGGFVVGGTSGMSGGSGGFAGDACAFESHRGETLPLDMYVMFDQSLSMNCAVPSGGTRWEAVVAAFRTFVTSPGAAGIGVGIQYFGQGIPFASSCNVADFARPDVPIALLPGNSMAIVNSLGAHAPSSDTATQPALQGAIDHGKAWKQQNPSHTVIVVLVTDGQPNACGSTVAGVAQVAASGASGVPQIPTFVIGVISPGTDCGALFDPNPPNQADLDSVARSGGTNQALMVDSSQGNPGQQFLDNMNKIRGSAVIPCELQIPRPTSGQLDFNRVNVYYTPPSGGQAPLINVGDASRCDPNTGGWYYDNPQQPTRIVLCPKSCADVTISMGGQVDVQLGCQTITGPLT